MTQTGLAVPAEWQARAVKPWLPSGFDPLDPAADNARLREVGLPPRPDPLVSPISHKVWTAIMQQRDFQAARLVSFLPTAPELLLVGGSRMESSHNWCGGRIAPSHAHRFDLIVGCWTVPTLVPSTAPDASGLARCCSIWIGFGAHRRWSRNLPQMGTLHIEGTPDRHLPFIQWWIRGDPNSGQIIISHPTNLAPGDKMLAMLWLLSPTRMAYFLMRASPPFGLPGYGYLDMQAGKNPHPLATAEGVSAEWVFERPRDPVTGRLHPLPNLAPVQLFDCAAEPPTGPERPLEAARLMRMIDRQGPQRRLMCIASSRHRGQPAGAMTITRR